MTQGRDVNGLNPASAAVPASFLATSGTHTIRGRIIDKDDGFTDSTTTITVTNTAPVAADDSYSTTRNTPLLIDPPGVLANDTDADGNPLTAAVVSQPAHGALLLTSDGAFNYIPADGFIGQDSFSYTASDGLVASNSATVTITVQADTGLLGYWQFDDGAGTTAVDRSGSLPPNNATLASGASFTTSAAPITSFADPGSLNLTGTTTSTVSVPNSAINRLTNGFTVMGWIKPSGLSGYQRVIGAARTTTGSNGWSFGLFNSSILFSTIGKKDYTSSSLALKTGQWYHIAAVMDTSNAVTFYINGQLVGTVTGTAPATADTDDLLLIGASTASGGSTPTELFKGQIDDLRVYNRVLSAAEVVAATGVTSCSESVLRATFLLGERAGTITLDGACTYTLAAAETGGNGLVIASATTLEGNGATIARSPNAPAFRLLSASSATSALTIRNLTLRGGSTTSNGAGLSSSRDLTLSNVRFENNAGGSGGALLATKSLTVENGFFRGNTSAFNGGAISLSGPSGRITNSVFVNNSSVGSGAAIRSGDQSNLTLLNNTFTDQYKNPDEAVLINGPATVQNNIFENFKLSLTASGAPAVVSEDYNLFASIEADPRALSGATLTRGGHDRLAISSRFVNAATSNYRLQQNSPAIDLGTGAGVAADADGNARPYAGGAVDIGAYEYQGVGTPSISILKTGSPYAAASGQTQFLLTVINETTSPLNDLQLVEQLPAGATLVPGSISGGGTFSGGTLTWNLPPLDPSQRKRVGYRVTATQDLVSDQYQVSSISNPALTASGPALTTPYTTTVTALGFFPFSDGYGFANYGDGNDSDVSADDIASIFGADKVCKTQNPCVLTASAEAYRQSMVASNGGHCFGMAMASLWIYDRSDITPGDYQAGADITFDLLKINARALIQRFYTTQLQTPVSTTVPAFSAAKGAAAVVDTLKTNLANPAAADRYTISFWKPDGSSGHAVTPYALKQIDADHYWIYVYDNNYPNNFDRVFKVAHENDTWTWVYEGGAINPTAPPSTYAGDDNVVVEDGKTADHRVRFQLKSLRNTESFPKKCTDACNPGPFRKTAPISGTVLAQTTSATLSWQASETATGYDYCYDTTNDDACSSWKTTKSLSAAVNSLTPNTTYYWQVRAYNGSYTYADGKNTAFWSFKTPATMQANALMGPQLLSAAQVGEQSSVTMASDDPPAASAGSYDFQLEGEGYLLITRSDGKRAGVDPTGQSFAEIPGAEEIDHTTGLGLNIPNILRIPHEPGMTYRASISDRQNAYGNLAAPADLTIFGPGFVARLKGLKLDSPEDPEAPHGTNDVVGVTFDADNHRLAFTASALDSDTPSLSLAISQGGAPDYTLTLSGAQMPSGRTLSVGIDPTTGKVVIENDDPASNSYRLDVERINLDGSKTRHHFDTISDGTGVGAVVDLGPGWTGGTPSVGQNNVPVASADSYTTNAGSTLEVAAPGPLGNDSGAGLTAALVAGPSHGSLTLNPDGSFSYTPASGYAGSDSFTYRAASGLFTSNVATVSITVNAAPVATNDSYATFANTALTVSAPGLLGNDSDAEGSPLTAVLVAGPSRGSLMLNPNGSFSYTPASGYVGSDSFTYQTSDGSAASNVATVSIAVGYTFAGFFSPVNNPPTLNEVNAGQSVPVKFSLGGNFGLGILAAGYPVSQQVACPGGAPVNDVGQSTTSPSGLTYDTSSGRYTYIWKTNKDWSGSCRLLTVRLADGTDHTALFKFR